MLRSRPDARVCRVRRAVALLGVLLAVMIVSGCHQVNRLGGDFRNHPPELVGEWVDSAKSTSADTALWILGPDGEDASAHRRLVAAAGVAGSGGLPGGGGLPRGTGAYVTTERRHYGYWFVRGAMDTASEHALCFTKRPGRSAPQCSSFALDTLREGSVARRRLRVHGYAGAHHVADRVLLAQTP